MKKFCVKGTRQACLNDRLANARFKRHTDLRSMEAKIYRIANMSMDDYFRDELDKAVFRDFQKLVDDTGFVITPDTSYMEAASIIKQYVTKYPEDEIDIDLIAHLLHPVWRFSSLLFWGDSKKRSEKATIDNAMLNNAILRQNKNSPMIRNFYVWMDEYLSVLECIFPEDEYQQSFHDAVYSEALFNETMPMLLEFVFLIINDSDELKSKWPMLLKFMIDPYDKLYRENRGKEV